MGLQCSYRVGAVILILNVLSSIIGSVNLSRDVPDPLPQWCPDPNAARGSASILSSSLIAPLLLLAHTLIWLVFIPPPQMTPTPYRVSQLWERGQHDKQFDVWGGKHTAHTLCSRRLLMPRSPIIGGMIDQRRRVWLESKRHTYIPFKLCHVPTYLTV